MEADIWKPVGPNQIIGRVRKVDGDCSTHQATNRASYSAPAVEEETITTAAATVSSSAPYDASEGKGTTPLTLQSPWASSSAAMTFVQEVGF